jgi:hypothetical protein
MPESARPPALPTAVSAPAGHRHAMTLRAKGKLSYECRPIAGMSGAYGWVLGAIDARLLHWSGLSVGRVYAGPTWAHRDGSRVAGRLRAASPAGDGYLPVQLWEVHSTGEPGELSDVTYVQRLNAKGSLPDARCQAPDVGRGQSMSFESDFAFYRKD